MKKNRILVTGGAGYVGSMLVPELLKAGFAVTVFDLYLYGKDVFSNYRKDFDLKEVYGDIRDTELLKETMKDCKIIIHLACISNDPSFELDPLLGKSINFDCFKPMVITARKSGIERFIYASSSSVYGIKNERDVKEDAVCQPLTDYSRFKLECEKILINECGSGNMTRIIVRPATICGYAPRLRLDLTVNILTIHALVNKKIRIFGGKQLRPNLNIKDMVRAYKLLLNAPHNIVDGVPFNVGYQNKSVEEIAKIVKATLGDEAIKLSYEETNDTRSYHINSDRIRDKLGFEPEYTIEDAIESIVSAYKDGLIVNPMSNSLYYNIKRMQEIKLL